MTTQETPLDRFKAARSKFLNSMIENFPSEPISAPKREFKHKVKMSGFIKTTTRGNPTGDNRTGVSKSVKNYFTPVQRADSTSSLSSVEDSNSDISTHNVKSGKKVTFADPIESVIPDKEVKQQLPETQHIIDHAEQWSNLLNESKNTVPFIQKERSDSDVSSWSTSSVDSQQAPSNQAEIDDMLFGGIDDTTLCLEPQKNEVVSSAEEELETVKFLKTLSKGEREKLGFSSPQSGSKNAEKSTRAYNLLLNTNLSSGTQSYSLLQRDRITHNVSKEPEMDRRSSWKISPKQESILERDRITHDKVGREPMERSSHNEASPRRESNPTVCRITRNNTKNAFNNKPPLSAISEIDIEINERGSRGC